MARGAAKTYRTMEYVALGVGGAALVTGGILYFLGARSKAPPLAVLPSVGPGQGGLVLARSF